MNFKLLPLFLIVSMMGVVTSSNLMSQPSLPLTDPTGSEPEPMVIHPQFRKWAKPSGGSNLTHNPPFFLWPVADKREATYDIRLSRDAGFSELSFSKNDIPYAIYCPYQKLPPGQWYWQYRESGREWSEPMRFVVSESSKAWNPPDLTALKQSIPQEHPRLLIKKGEGLKDFRRRAGHTTDARRIIENADAWLDKPLIPEMLDPEMLKETDPLRLKKNRKDAAKRLGDTAIDVLRAMTRAYLLTGDEKYARRGMEWALHVAEWDPYGVSRLSDFGDSRCMLAMAMAYDTFYKLWSEPEKTRLRGAITVRADRFYNDWKNLIEAKVLSNHVWQHIFHYFFHTTLATFGDIPESEKWLTYLYELFLARAPALGRDDGAWLNGNKYFTMNMAVLLDVPLTLKDLTGFDFMKHIPWYQNNPYYLWYSFPPHSSSDGFGDNSKGFVHPDTDYIAYADALGRITGHPLATAYARAARDGTGLKVTDDHHLRWIRLKFLQGLPEPDVSHLPGLAKARRFPDAGLVYMHSDLDNTARNLMLAMRSSPFGSYGHMLADQNTFNLLYGGKPLFFHSGYKISMDDPHRQEWYKHTRSHNGILINDEGQPYSTEAYGSIPRFLDGQYMSYAIGDASQAYHSVEHGETVDHGLKRFKRHILMLYPDLIVIYDDLEAEEMAEWSWLLHAPGGTKLHQSGNEFLFTLPHVTSQVNVFGTTQLTWNVTDTFEVAAENWRGKKDRNNQKLAYKDEDWHLKGISDSTRNMRYLAIIQVRPNGELSRVISDGEGGIQCGDWIIRAELDGTQDSELQISRSDGEAAFVMGQKKVRMGKRVFTGEKIESGKLVERVDGKWIFKESQDTMPDAVEAARNFQSEINLKMKK